MDTAGPGFFQACFGSVALLAAGVAFGKGAWWLLARLVGGGPLVRTQSDAEAAYTEMRWLAGENGGAEGDETWVVETDPRTGKVTVLPAAPAQGAHELPAGSRVRTETGEAELGERRTDRCSPESPDEARAFIVGLAPDTLIEIGDSIFTAVEVERLASVWARYQGAAS